MAASQGVSASGGLNRVVPCSPSAAQAMLHRSLPRVLLRGVQIHAITEAQCVEHIFHELDTGRGGCVVTHNLDHLRRLEKDRSFAALSASASLVLADGMPLIWASRLVGQPLPQRVTGSNLVSSLSAAAAQRGRSIFLLGGAPGTAHAAACVLRQRHPTLSIAGVACPPVGFDSDSQYVTRLVSTLTAADPDIIFVALGSPKQEQLIHRLHRQLPDAWWLGVGISFSFLCGHVRRAPRWMRRVGLEWAHRLAQEPWRLGRRYLLEGLPFGIRLLASSAWQALSMRRAD